MDDVLSLAQDVKKDINQEFKKLYFYDLSYMVMNQLFDYFAKSKRVIDNSRKIPMVNSIKKIKDILNVLKRQKKNINFYWIILMKIQ